MTLSLVEAGTVDTARVLESLGSSPAGLSATEARQRLLQVGPNAVRGHGAHPFVVLARQLNSPLLLLLAGAALVSIVVGERASAGIILGIVGLSVGLGFVNEFRSERAIEALHERIRHTALTLRDGRAVAVDVTELVPGDLVRLGVGDVVPADLRLLEADRMGLFGFTALPPVFLLILAGMVAVYLGLAEVGKAFFYRPAVGAQPLAAARPGRLRRIERRAARWSHRRPPAAHPSPQPRHR